MEKALILLHSIRIIGDNCRKIRITRGYSTLDLSAKSDVSERTIYQIESGHCNVTVKTLIYLSQALDCSVEDLIR